jgi:hypothetical protein
MAIHWQIPFKSLRTGYLYTVNVYDSAYSGSAIILKGGAQPFITQEGNDTDIFTPIRTQTGYIRIIDDGKDASGNTLSAANSWTAMLPTTNTERPVTLTCDDGSANYTVWQGFIQTQNFSGVLYGNPQEREIPVQCGVSALAGVTISTEVTEMKNFAYLIASLFTNVIDYDTFTFQGGQDAQSWLRNTVDYQNFMQVIEGETVAKYNALDVLTDVCRFWGWTCRTQGRQVFFTCMDDTAEQSSWATFTRAQMLALTASTTGTYSSTRTIALSGDIFASTGNDETMIQGIKTATVKVEVNPESTAIKFAPSDLEKEMGNPSIWVQTTGKDMVGYFKTPFTRSTLDGKTLYATAFGANDGFERRIIFSSKEAEDGDAVDVMLITRDYLEISGVAVPIIQMYTKRAMAYGGGTLKFRGDIYVEAERYSESGDFKAIWVRVGIGMTRETAHWFYLTAHGGYTWDYTIDSGWNSTSTNQFLLNVNGGSINGVKVIHEVMLLKSALDFASIPVAANLYGYMYIDILGANDISSPYQIANFEVDFSREETVLPTTATQVRSRTIKPELATSRKYTAQNASNVDAKWNADCIFASDNLLEYGHGLIMSPSGSFVSEVPYGTSTEHPEQHLANRVAAFGQKARRMVSMELRSNALNVEYVTATKKVSFEGTTYHPISISHDWRDDITKISMIEL